MSQDNTFSNLRKDLKLLVNSIENMLNNCTDNKNPSDLENLRQKAKHILDEARKSLGDSTEHIMKQTREVANLANNYLHEKPWAGVGIGATLGLILGCLLMRR
ncbi:MAG: hypothetical protein V6009_00755 [Candidatus Dasytiphilus stammeri]